MKKKTKLEFTRERQDLLMKIVLITKQAHTPPDSHQTPARHLPKHFQTPSRHLKDNHLISGTWGHSFC